MEMECQKSSWNTLQKNFSKKLESANHDNFEGYYIFGKSAKKALNDNNNSAKNVLSLPIFPLNLNSKLVIAGVL